MKAVNPRATIRERDSPGQPPEPPVPRLLTLLAALALIAAFALWRPPAPPTLANVAPAPMPAWAILPPGGKVVASGVYPPQPPYGAAATITYAIDETAEEFLAACGAQLAAADYAVRRVTPVDLPFNAPDAQFEADERPVGAVGAVTSSTSPCAMSAPPASPSSPSGTRRPRGCASKSPRLRSGSGLG
jgi:hypothetical protein